MRHLKLVSVHWHTIQIAIAFMAIVIVMLCMSLAPANATWKPEYGKENPKVMQWFNTRKLMPAAAKRLKFDDCCKKADRLMTKVIAGRGPHDEDQWFYYINPNCTQKGCPLDIIPADTVHSDPIPPGPEFKQLRAEGVLFTHAGQVTCFWPPESGI